MNTPLPPPIIIDAARNERKRLAALREELDEKIAELDDYLKSVGVLVGHSRGSREDPNSLAGQIKAMARKMIVPGQYVTSRKIYEALIAEGVVFPETGKPPVERVGTVIWKMRTYTSDRERGWSIKGEPPQAEPPSQGEML